jgi:hypothetical protein
MISWYRFLDMLQSFWNTSRKTLRGRRKWGSEWRDKVRPGRTYRRVEFNPMGFPPTPFTDSSGNEGVLHLNSAYRIRPEPGWEWFCPNCKEHSLITESMMPDILKDWNTSIQRMVNKALEKGIRVPPVPPVPTPATAGCPNCRYRPGAPE